MYRSALAQSAARSSRDTVRLFVATAANVALNSKQCLLKIADQ